MLHVLSSMKDLKQEMEDYPYSATVDILDCLGYLIRFAPTSYNSQSGEVTDPFSLDTILKEIGERKASKSGTSIFEDPLASFCNPEDRYLS